MLIYEKCYMPIYENSYIVICKLQQSQEDFAFAFMSCLKSIGGVPKIIVIDNLKAGVIKASCGHTPTLNELFFQIATHYNAVVIPTYPRKPKFKAYVKFILM